MSIFANLPRVSRRKRLDLLYDTMKSTEQMHTWT